MDPEYLTKGTRPVSPEAQLASLREQLNMVAERHGPYAQLWAAYQQAGPGELATAMGAVEGLINEVFALSSPGAQNSTDYAERVAAAVLAAHEKLPDWLRMAEAKLRGGAAPAAGPGAGHALAVLDALPAPYPAATWMQAQRQVRTAVQKRWVVGPQAELDQISVLVKKYVNEWTQMGTDGLKGASYEAMARLEALRMQIVLVISNSASIQLKACCCPGTSFYQYIASLAAQSCSSQDVQNFAGWWAANAKYEG